MVYIQNMKQEVSKVENKKNRREGRGRVIALSHRMYRLQNKDTFYVESESSDGRYYFVRFNSSFAGGFCSCKDYESNRSDRCKHQYAVEYGIRFNTITEVDRLPEEVRGKSRGSVLASSQTATSETNYENESIRTLNDIEKAEIEAEEYRNQRLITYEEDDYSF
jgi:predicted nucleic acid-binding Zn finger protein